jgi:hypothetical protein
VSEALDALEEVAAGGDGAGLVADLRGAWTEGEEEARRRVDRWRTSRANAGNLRRWTSRLLYDENRELFSIGYSVTHHRLDASHYDLLASEAPDWPATSPSPWGRSRNDTGFAPAGS